MKFLSRRHATCLFFILERTGRGSFQELFSTIKWDYFVPFQADGGLIFRGDLLPFAPIPVGLCWLYPGQGAGAHAVIKD